MTNLWWLQFSLFISWFFLQHNPNNLVSPMYKIMFSDVRPAVVYKHSVLLIQLPSWLTGLFVLQHNPNTGKVGLPPLLLQVFTQLSPSFTSSDMQHSPALETFGLGHLLKQIPSLLASLVRKSQSLSLTLTTSLLRNCL